MGTYLSQYQLYNNHEFRGMIEMAATLYSDAILAEARFPGDEARHAFAEDIVNATYGKTAEALARMARVCIGNADLRTAAITPGVIHPQGLIETNWSQVAEAVYRELLPPT